MKIAIDSNVIVRYLMHEDEHEFTVAKKAIDSGAIIIPEVLAEVIYVLEGKYKIPRVEIVDSLKDLLDDIEIENKESYLDTLDIYSSCKLDYVDCLLIQRNKTLKQDVVTFDKKLKSKLL